MVKTKVRRAAIVASLLVGCVGLVGCTGGRKDPSPLANMSRPQIYSDPGERANNPGSLFDDAESQGLFADSRARRVGDIVLIKIVEESKGKNKAETTADSDSSSEFGVKALFGLGSVSPIGIPIGGDFNGRVGGGPVLSTTSSSKFDGSGETKRENYVTATLAARVIRVMPGGVMEIEGARETRVNDETQYMVVTGLVRAKDVSSDNSVYSTQMAEARIEYYGEGVVSDKQKPGWFVRLMDAIWPF